MNADRVGAAIGWLLNIGLIAYLVLNWDEKASDSARIGLPIIFVILLMWYFIDRKLERSMRATAELRDLVNRR
jgi:hypothetical protein